MKLKNLNFYRLTYNHRITSVCYVFLVKFRYFVRLAAGQIRRASVAEAKGLCRTKALRRSNVRIPNQSTRDVNYLKASAFDSLSDKIRKHLFNTRGKTLPDYDTQKYPYVFYTHICES